MPVVRHPLESVEPGTFYACRVLDAGAPPDAGWEHLSYEQITSCLWQLVSGAGPDELSRAA
jgi:hypothetical protein